MSAQRTQQSADERMQELTRPEKPFATMRWTVTAVLVIAFAASAMGIEANWGRLLELPQRLATLLGLMFLPPDPEWIGRGIAAMWESVAIAWIGTVIGALLSFPLAFLAAANISGKLAVGVVRQILNVFRAIPEIIFAILFLPMFGLDPLTGAIAIGISSIGTLGKLSAEVIEAIDTGPVEAADAAGATGVQRVRWGVIPQVMPEIVALWLYRFEINIRASAILGLVGAGGIGTILEQQLRIGRQWAAAGTSLIIIVLATLLVDEISGRLRRRIIRGPEKKGDGDPEPEDPAAGAWA